MPCRRPHAPLAVVLTLTFVLPFALTAGPSLAAGDAPSATPSTPPTTTIVVKDTTDLITALGSDRTIELTTGVYDLGDLKAGLPAKVSTGISTEEVFDGRQLVLANLRNLTLRGPARGRAEVRVTPRYAYVLSFKGASNLTLENLLLQHAPELGECAGGVLAFEDATGVTLTNVELAGCGTEGLTLTRVNGFTFKGSTITKCTVAILTADSSQDLRFEGSRFVGNGEYDLVNLSACNDVTFTRCVFKDNRAPGCKLFAVDSCEGLVLTDVKASGNQVEQLSNDAALEARLR